MDKPVNYMSCLLLAIYIQGTRKCATPIHTVTPIYFSVSLFHANLFIMVVIETLSSSIPPSLLAHYWYWAKWTINLLYCGHHFGFFFIICSTFCSALFALNQLVTKTEKKADFWNLPELTVGNLTLQCQQDLSNKIKPVVVVNHWGLEERERERENDAYGI